MGTQALGLRQHLEQYASYADGESLDEIANMAEPLKGSRILNLSAVPSRPQVSDTLTALMPLFRSVGMIAEWRVIPITDRDIELNKALSLALDGHFVQWTAQMRTSWPRLDAAPADISFSNYDFVVVHDAELVGMIDAVSAERNAGLAKWIWHCHSDLARAQPDVQDFLQSRARSYHLQMVCSQALSAERIDHRLVAVPLTIDPLSPRNCDLPQTFIEMVLKQHGLDPRRPIVFHISHARQDLCATSNIVEGFHLAKQRIPELQLVVLFEGEANEEWTHTRYRYLASKLGDCHDARVVPLASGVGSMEINAFQRAAVAVVDWSDSEYTADDVLEAMWKARPVIVRAATARRLGVEDGRNVCVARSAAECANRIVGLIGSPATARTIGRGAREHTQEKFLITGLLHTYVTVLGELATQEVATPACAVGINRVRSSRTTVLARSSVCDR